MDRFWFLDQQLFQLIDGGIVLARQRLGVRQLTQQHWRVRSLSQSFVQNLAGLVELLLMQISDSKSIRYSWISALPVFTERRESIVVFSFRDGQKAKLHMRFGIVRRFLDQACQIGARGSGIPKRDPSAATKKSGPAVERPKLQYFFGLLHGLIWPLLDEIDLRHLVTRGEEIVLPLDGRRKLIARSVEIPFEPVCASQLSQ